MRTQAGILIAVVSLLTLPVWAKDNPEWAWEVTMPAGAKFEMTMIKLSENEYQLKNARVFSGVYRREKNKLIVTRPGNKKIEEMEWTIVRKDKLILTVPPSSLNNGADYTGAVAVLKRPQNQT